MRRSITNACLLGLVLTGACAPETTLPAFRAPAVAAARADGDLPFVPNDVVYRNTSVRNAQGRSGAATLSARALVGRDNVAVLEVSTGDLDLPDAAPGSIDKVQVKTFAFGTDRQLSSENERTVGTGGHWSRAYPEFVRGQRIQVQANVSGIDPTRNDVVTLDAFTAWRPDLRPGKIAAPAQVLVGTPVNVLVPVMELNGDLGARADCVLYADGVAADRSNGIWVDRGDVVTCLFRVTFTTAGTRRLEVRLENVRPADYDESNNVSSTTIAVLDPVSSFHGTATVSNEVTGTEQAIGRTTLFPKVDLLTSDQRRQVRMTLDATMQSPALGLTQVSVSRESDGQLFGPTVVQLDLSGGCGVRPVQGQFFSLCQAGSGTYQLLWSTTYGSIAYWSIQSQAQWNGTRYVYTATGLPPEAPIQREAWGSSLTLRVVVSAAGREITASPVVPLVPYDLGTSVPYTCVAGGCSGSRAIRHGVTGQATF